MSLKDQLRQTLATLPLFSGCDQTARASDVGQDLTCQLVSLDSLACAFTELSLESPALAARDISGLKHTAEQLSARLTYLLEPISPIETDPEGCTVQMRSKPPQQEENRTSYYELLVSRSGKISLSRYTRSAGQSRQVVPAAVTREVLLRLAGDFSAVA
jgi:hypothetical protein